MNRQWLWGLGIVAMLALALPARAETKFGMVDMNRAFTEFYKTKLADAQLKEMAEEFTNERKEIVGRMEALQTAANKARDDAQVSGLTADARAKKQAEAEDKLVGLRNEEQKLRQFDESRRKQLEDQGRRMRGRLVDEIREAVKTYARTQGLNVVLDSSGQTINGVEAVLYRDDQTDITGAVLDILNKSQKTSEPEAPKAGSKTGSKQGK
jgi:outer membrane protein